MRQLPIRALFMRRETTAVGTVRSSSSNPKQFDQPNNIAEFMSSAAPLLILVTESDIDSSQQRQALISSITARHTVIQINGNESLKPKQILNAICQFNTQCLPSSTLRFEEQLKHTLNTIKKEKIPNTLIINQAHQLPLSSLAALAHLVLLQENGVAHLKIILNGQPKIANQLSRFIKTPIPSLVLSDNHTILDKHQNTDQQNPQKHSNLNEITNLTLLGEKCATLWQQHQIKVVSLLAISAIGYTILFMPKPTQPTHSLTTLAKADAKRRSTPPRYEIMLADATTAQPFKHIAQSLKLKQAITIKRDHFTHHYHIHVGRFSSYKTAQILLTKIANKNKQYHPHIHQLTS